MAKQTVILGEGVQTIRLVPTDSAREGGLLVPASATYEIFHIGGDDDKASAPATVDSASETTTAAVGINAASKRLVEVADTSAFRAGGIYQLSNTTGDAIAVRVRRIVSATQLLLEANVRGSFPIGSTIAGVECSGITTLAINDNEDNVGDTFIVEWNVTDGDGDSHVFREVLEVVSALNGALAIAVDVEQLDGTAANLNNRRDKVERALAQAHDDFWRKAQAKGIVRDGFLPGANGKAWVTYRAAELLRLEMGQERDQLMAESHRDEYRQIMNDLTSGTDVKIIDRDDEPNELSDPDGVYEQWDLC